MLDKALSSWRGHHVLIVGTQRSARFTHVLLDELGASAALITPEPNAQALCRAMTAHRIAAVIVPRMADLCTAADSASACLARLKMILDEAREAGVPLVVLATDAGVYRAQSRPAREDDPLGGETREGLIHALLSLYADGVARSLAGDAVNTLIVHHMPCLGADAPSVAQYTRWCDALLRDEVVPVEHPAMQGAFAHPLEVAHGVLMLGAMCLSLSQGGSYNLALEPPCLLPNRTAAQRLIARAGGSRPIHESEPPLFRPAQMLDGSRAKALCGAACRLSAVESLSMLFELTRAEKLGEEQVQATLREQARRILESAP